MPTETDRSRTTVILATLALGASAYTVLQSMVLPALPVIQADLHTSQATVAWLLTAYLLSASIATPILGRLGDLFGKKAMLIVVFGALSAGSLLAGLSSSIGLLIVARVIQGLAGAVFPLAFGIIRDEFPAPKVAASIGLMSGMLGIGSGVGVVLAGPIIDALSWHWLFWFPLMVSSVALVATVFFIPESTVRATGSVNLPAAAALSGWLIALLLGLSKGSSWGWTAPGTLGLFAAAVVLFVGWIQVENRSSTPLIDMRMMRIPAVWWTNTAALLLGVGMYATFILVPPLLQTPKSAGYGLGASVTISGLYLLPSTVTMLLTGMLIGRISARFGSKPPLVVGSLIAAAAFGVLVLAHGNPWDFLVALSLTGIGIGLAFSAMANLIIEAVPSDQTGAATGMNANIRTIGGSIGSQVVATILASGLLASGLPKESSYTACFALLCVILVVAAVAAGVVPITRTRAGRSAEGSGSTVAAAGESIPSARSADPSQPVEPAGSAASTASAGSAEPGGTRDMPSPAAG